MKSEKEISSDLFTPEEKVLVDLRVASLTARLGRVADKKEEKEILKEAKRLVMKARIEREAMQVSKVKKPRRPAAAKESEVNAFSWSGSLRKNPRAMK